MDDIYETSLLIQGMLRTTQRGPTVWTWTAKESKAAVQSMKGGRLKKSTRVVKRIKTRGVKWTEPEWQAYSYPPIYGTLTKDSHESREHREPRHPAMAETNSHASRDLDRAELTVISNIGSPPDEYREPDEEPRQVSYGSSPSTNRSSRHQRMGSFDTSLTESLLHGTISPAETEGSYYTSLTESLLSSTLSPAYEQAGYETEDYYGSISSVGDTNYNESSHYATPSVYTTSNGLVALMGSDLEEMHIPARITPMDRFLFLTEIGLEVLSVVFDQLSSPKKPHYALAGMLCANVAVVLCIVEVICKCVTQRELLTSQNSMRSIIMMMLPEITGLGLAIIQCINSGLQFYYYSRHADNILKASLTGIFIALCMFFLKFRRN